MSGLGRITICGLLLLGGWLIALDAANTVWALPVALCGFVFGIWLVLTEARP